MVSDIMVHKEAPLPLISQHLDTVQQFGIPQEQSGSLEDIPLALALTKVSEQLKENLSQRTLQRLMEILQR